MSHLDFSFMRGFLDRQRTGVPHNPRLRDLPREERHALSHHSNEDLEDGEDARGSPESIQSPLKSPVASIGFREQNAALAGQGSEWKRRMKTFREYITLHTISLPLPPTIFQLSFVLPLTDVLKSCRSQSHLFVKPGPGSNRHVSLPVRPSLVARTTSVSSKLRSLVLKSPWTISSLLSSPPPPPLRPSRAPSPAHPAVQHPRPPPLRTQIKVRSQGPAR